MRPTFSMRTLWILAVSAVTVTLLCPSGTTVYGAPATLDSNERSFPLELQPPLVEADFNSQPSAIDSYGNPIETLKPIDTPDGRKVVSAQGLQFEIPNYASGITEIKQPSDDLLPPFIDPIAVAEYSEAPTGTGSDGATSTSVEVENAPLVEVTANQQQQQESAHSPNILPISNDLPDYLLELNDPDIGGPVDYVPSEDGTALKVIAWDLLAPYEAEPSTINSERVKVVGLTSTAGDYIAYSTATTQKPVEESVTTESTSQRTTVGHPPETTYSTLPHGQRGSVHYTSTTRAPSTSRTPRTTTTTTTTTTRRPTTTTTRRTTTLRTTTAKPTTTSTTTTTTTTAKPTTTTTTAEPLDSSEFYRLEAGDSYTLPSWLADIDDPELDAAVTFIVPTDINEYNHTVDRDLQPPLEPYMDLLNIQLSAPIPSESETTTSTTSRPTTTTTTTIRPTTTRSTTTSTTTQRPTTTTTARRTTISTQRQHWVLANPTTTTTTQRPAAFNSFPSTSKHPAQTHFISTANQFHSSSNPAQFGTTTPTIHSQTSHTHEQSLTSFNQNLPASTIDPITSQKADVDAAAKPFGHSNPFLPTFNNGAYNTQPKPFSRNSGKYNPPKTTSTTTTTTSTSTTTTTTPAPFEENPFDSATVPAWLSSFDYPDVGPGVPFVYTPEESESPVQKELQPPSNFDAQATDNSRPIFVSSSPASFNSFNSPHNVPHLHDTQTSIAHSSVTNSFSSPSTIPSKVTLPLPSINDNNYNSPQTTIAAKDSTNDKDNRFSSANTHAETSSSFNQNFAAPFEAAADASGVGSAPELTPTSTAEETLPTAGSTKTTFSKSDDGKVITNNVFLSAAGGTAQPQQQQTVKPFGFSGTFGTQQKDYHQASTTNQFFSTSAGSSFATSGTNSFSSTSSNFNKASSPSAFSAAATGFTKNPFTSASTNTATSNGGTAAADGSRYTGSFGGAPGVLGAGKVGYAVQTDGSIRDPDHTYRPVSVTTAAATAPTASPAVPRPVTQSAFAGFNNHVAAPTAAAAVGGQKYTGRFGGPPGILIPYDNSKVGNP